MPYIVTIPSSPAYSLKGMKWDQFEPLENKELDITIVHRTVYHRPKSFPDPAMPQKERRKCVHE